MWTDYTDPHSTVPTKDQVLVPETLLKKRKSQEQSRAVRREELQKRKEVSILFSFILSSIDCMMYNYTTPRLDYGRCCRLS